MERCKTVGSLKFFLTSISNYLRGLLVQSTEFLILFHPEFRQVQCWSATTVAKDFILIESDGKWQFLVGWYNTEYKLYIILHYKHLHYKHCTTFCKDIDFLQPVTFLIHLGQLM